MTASEAAGYIESFRYKGSRPGLERVGELLERLGNPHDELRFIHVAGTNGKGSVCAMLASILKEAGYKTGLFTSPHLYRLHEYFNVDGCEIVEADLSDLIDEAKPHIEMMKEQPTEFELITALAIYHFYRQHCEFVVLETGLGGRMDSTNIIPAPLVAAITNIGLEHVEYLGDTVEKIAAEKAGIIKPGAEVVLARQDKAVVDVIREKCRQVNARICITEAAEAGNADLSFQSFCYRNRADVNLGLLGNYQLKNAAVALDIIDCLKDMAYPIPEQTVLSGMRKTVWPGRFEVLRKSPGVILDGAHNPDGTTELVDNLNKYFPQQNIIFIMGVMKDKKYERMVNTLSPLASAFITVTPDSERALPAEQLTEVIGEYFKGEVYSLGNIPEAIGYALKLQRVNEIICICGTLYMQKEVRKAWNEL